MAWGAMPEISGSGTAGPGDGKSPVAGIAKVQSAAGACPYHTVVMPLDPEALRTEAARLLGTAASRDDFLKIKKLLTDALGIDSLDAQGRTRWLLGLACFHLAAWAEARKHLEEAALRDPGNTELKALLARATTNQSTRIDVSMDAMPDLAPAALLRPPAWSLREPASIEPLAPAAIAGLAATLLRRVISLSGGAVTELLITVCRRLRDRKTIFAYQSWDRRSAWRGKLELAGIREELNGDALQSTYDSGLVGHQQPGQRRPAWTERFRSATGAWTTDDPMEGAAGTEFQRTGSPVSGRRNRVNDPLPSPREVSRLILAAEHGKPREEVPFLNLLTIAWLQAQVHDWASHPPTPSDGFYSVPLAPDDPLFKRFGIGALQVPRSAASALPQQGKLTFLNECTHWWDASHIYGSDQATQDRLRSDGGGHMLADGKLRIEGDLLPLHPDTGIEDSGFTRNWWIGLDIIHTLFVRHHNYICGELKADHPGWSSDQLFHTARLVNAAITAKIHSVEWTPAVLPNRKVVDGMAANWWGLAQATLKPFGKRRISSMLEPVHPVLGGIVGGRRDNHGKPYGVSEEFTEIYRFHAAIPDSITLRPVVEHESVPPVPTDATRGAMARRMVGDFGLATLLNSFGHQHMPALVPNNYPAFMSGMSADHLAVIDIGTVDILRGRERGVPPYNEFRRMLGLNPIGRFADLGCSAGTVSRLEKLYGNDGVEKMDLLAGACCERWRPENFGFGETLFTVFIQMASRRLQADPFFTDKLNARYYTAKGMALLENATFKQVLLQHYPQLGDTGLRHIHNAFEPWGTTPALNPEQHPLAAIERY